ncbi:MAG: SDR family oxidoreductase [candidate division KSB1 bacterium]|nr:SDR family oxidoreductase [candidate division KSB1 bacterium]MDZ7305355.1 SDR family oxidoreductase [candidate division KSB1 bacterium]MDZ7314447.1 SDR family oxidoreductase [candidate division KSB1 bacterium]
MFEPDLLHDKVILVTGGGSGLGLSMSKRFAELGATLAICGRNPERLADGAMEIKQAGAGREVFAYPCDVRDYQAVEKMIAEIITHVGIPHVLVNNAAGNFLAATEELSPGGFDAIVRIVLYGTFNCTQILARHWLAQHVHGTVLNIVTTYAATGSAFVVPSACAKAGVLAMTRSLAVEWGNYGIRLNAIAPGPFPTAGAWKRLFPNAEFDEQVKRRIPLGRFGEHRELANLAAFLVSDEAGYINGECVTIDGGESLAGSGQFSQLVQLDRETLKKMMQHMRAR